jgi:hypothetical protein|tara:strand:+ start:177 stop:557 length:381 start_codon:yes stop_codon:yes gene_type:complete
MRTIVLAAVAAMAATSATAMDLGTSGLTLNTDVVAKHLVDAGTTVATINPELGYNFGLADFTVGTKLNLWDNANAITLDDEFDHLPVFDFGITYALQDNLELEATTSYDMEASDRGEITLVATFSF